MTSFNLEVKAYLDQKTDDVTIKQIENFVKSQLEEIGFNEIEATLSETETK